MPFTPKFVDLVRNVTVVQGTGPVTLGAAVSGYTSLATAAAPGEQFYYCIQGLDKPAEREVGRGTLQADGKVAREPINGSLTNFTAGTKTIAVVAAAEWFERLDGIGAGGGGNIGIASRSALAAAPASGAAILLLTEARREGIFVFDGSNLSARTSADSAQGLCVAPTSDPTGASGAWLRKFEGPVNPLWFGLIEGNASGANGAANSAALAAMLATLRTRAVNVSADYQGLERVQFPPGYFEFASTIDLTDGSFILEGADTGRPGGRGTVLKFPAGVTGIRVQRHNTSGASGPADIPTHRGGQSTIRNLALYGAYTTAEAEAHGIQLRGQANIENCYIDLFEGDGIFINAAAGSGTVEGNANVSFIRGCRIQRCRNGFYCDGADSNIITVLACDFSSNRQWGVWDSSFLGNTYTGCHAAANGWDGAANSIPTACTYSGNRYYVKVGQAAGASTNAPSGTTADNSWWGYIGAGGTYNGVVSWVSGTTFREGGACKSDNANARNAFFGCYVEGDQNPAQFIRPTLVAGGTLPNARGGVLTLGSDYIIAPGIFGENVFGQSRVAKPSSGTAIFRVHNDAALTGSLDSALDFAQGYESDGATPCSVAEIAGRGNGTNPATVAGSMQFATRAPGGTMTDRMQLDSGQLQPQSDNGISLGQAARRWLAAYITTVTGYGAITTNATNAGIGYRTGAGSTITQATSKSTGVTLSRPCGQITMSSAALAAGASVSFTLTNSVIAATDAVIVNIGSAATADSYEAQVTAVAAGSCRIQVRNISGGSLSEALVLNFVVIKGVAA